MRVLLVTGKGGAGTTTVAAATAARAAATGRKTLVLSLAGSPALGDVLGSPLGPVPTELDSGLSAVRPDAQQALAHAVAAARQHLGSVLQRAGAAGLDPTTLPMLPAADQVLALLALESQLDDGRWDVVVVDCPPVAETLRLLAMPDALGWYAARLFPVEHRALRAVRPLLSRVHGPALPPERLLTSLEHVRGRLDRLRAVLTSPATGVRLVLTAEPAALAETGRAVTALALMGHRLDALVVNRLVPASGAPFLIDWRARQQEQLDRAHRLAGSVPVLTVAEHAGGLVGPTALGRLGCPLEVPGAPAAPDPGPAVVRTVDGYALVLALPGASIGELDLARDGDELVVTVAGQRRLLALPSALRRCRVVGARLSDGSLSVCFEPDPELWPTSTDPVGGP